MATTTSNIAVTNPKLVRNPIARNGFKFNKSVAYKPKRGKGSYNRQTFKKGK